MRRKARLALGLLLLPISACSSSGHVHCPTPITYDDATLKKIEKAREALPRNSTLLQVLEDYENERDDLRFCK
jgi:hypothetical protein